MSVIEANIIINVPDGVDIERAIYQLRQMISQLNGNDTNINIVQIDDPISLNPHKIKG